MITSSLREIIEDAIVWDNHTCMPLRPGDDTYLPMLEQCRAAGIDIMSLNVGFGEQGMAEHIAMLASFRRWIADRSNAFLLIEKACDVRKAKASGRLGICFDIEGMNALDGQVDLVSLFYDLGVRWMLTAYNRANAAGSGCLDADDNGLTEFGRRVIREMNRVGMVICGSHTGYRTAQEMIELSDDPIIFSHSNPRALWDIKRNIPDELMIACAKRGGVIGLNGVGPFLGPNDASIETFVSHVEYTLELVGDDHVGIALDYVFDKRELRGFLNANPSLFPQDLNVSDMNAIEPWSLNEIAHALASRGHTKSTLRKLFGGNHLRIAEAVWH